MKSAPRLPPSDQNLHPPTPRHSTSVSCNERRAAAPNKKKKKKRIVSITARPTHNNPIPPKIKKKQAPQHFSQHPAPTPRPSPHPPRKLKVQKQSSQTLPLTKNQARCREIKPRGITTPPTLLEKKITRVVSPITQPTHLSHSLHRRPKYAIKESKITINSHERQDTAAQAEQCRERTRVLLCGLIPGPAKSPLREREGSLIRERSSNGRRCSNEKDGKKDGRDGKNGKGKGNILDQALRAAS